MLPFSKDTLCIIGILVCIIGMLYLFREVNKMKTSVVSRPPQPVPFVQRVQTPVHDTPVAAPPVPPPPVPPSPVPPAAPATEQA